MLFLAVLIDNCRIHFLAIIIILSVSLLGVFVYVVFDSNFERVEVNTVLIAEGDEEIVGLLYRLVSASILSSVPAVVLALNVCGTQRFFLRCLLGIEIDSSCAIA